MRDRLLQPARLLTTAALGLTGLAGCGGSGFTIDHTVVENAVQVAVARQQHVLAIVTCPVGLKARTGGRFACTVTFANGSQASVNVIEKDSHGNVHYSGLYGYVHGRPPRR